MPNKNVDISHPSFSERLTTLRRGRGMSRREVADAIGVSPRAYTNWEKGKQGTALEYNMLRLAEFFEVDFDYLVHGTVAPAPAPPDPAEAVAPPAVPVEPVAAPRPRSRWRPWGLVAMAVALLAVAAGWILPRVGNDVILDVSGSRLVVRDGIFRAPRWTVEHGGDIAAARVVDFGGESRIIYGVGGGYPDTGRLFSCSVTDGSVRWQDEPDLAEAGRVFGPVGSEAVGFSVRRIETLDLDGDGMPEIAVQYGHNMWYPAYVRIYRADGSVAGTYYNAGHCYDMRAADIDDDGKDELLVAATNNGKSYQGASLILLDDTHCSGASSDSLMLTECPVADSSLARVVFPQWDDRYMELCSGVTGGARLQAERILVHHTRDGESRITIDVCLNRCKLVVTLDGALNPLDVSASDAVLAAMSTWSDTEREQFLAGLDDWLARTYRYGALALSP